MILNSYLGLPVYTPSHPSHWTNIFCCCLNIMPSIHFRFSLLISRTRNHSLFDNIKKRHVRYVHKMIRSQRRCFCYLFHVWLAGVCSIYNFCTCVHRHLTAYTLYLVIFWEDGVWESKTILNRHQFVVWTEWKRDEFKWLTGFVVKQMLLIASHLRTIFNSMHVVICEE